MPFAPLSIGHPNSLLRYLLLLAKQYRGETGAEGVPQEGPSAFCNPVTHQLVHSLLRPRRDPPLPPPEGTPCSTREVVVQALAQVLGYGRHDAIGLLRCTGDDVPKALQLGLHTLHLDDALLNETLLGYAAANMVRWQPRQRIEFAFELLSNAYRFRLIVWVGGYVYTQSFIERYADDWWVIACALCARMFMHMYGCVTVYRANYLLVTHVACITHPPLGSPCTVRWWSRSPGGCWGASRPLAPHLPPHLLRTTLWRCSDRGRQTGLWQWCVVVWWCVADQLPHIWGCYPERCSACWSEWCSEYCTVNPRMLIN